MEEKTEQLRDIFIDVAGEETVTETQTEQRGSLVGRGPVDDRLADVIERMRERYGFGTALDDQQLCTVVKRFYDGADDGEIASAVDAPTEAVVEARLAFHLVREDEAAGVDRSTALEVLDGTASVREAASAADASVDAVAHAVQVLEARRESRQVSQRFRTEFEEILTDADIAVRLTADVRDDGLEEAAEDIETDTDF